MLVSVSTALSKMSKKTSVKKIKLVAGQSLLTFARTESAAASFRRPLLLFTKLDTQYNSPAAAILSTPAGTPRLIRHVPSTVTSSTAGDRAAFDSYTPSKCSTCVSCSSSRSSCSSSSCSSMCNSDQERELMDGVDETSVSSYSEFGVGCSQRDDCGQEGEGEILEGTFVSSHGDVGESGSQLSSHGQVTSMGGSGDFRVPEAKDPMEFTHNHPTTTHQRSQPARGVVGDYSVEPVLSQSDFSAGEESGSAGQSRFTDHIDSSFQPDNAACVSTVQTAADGTVHGHTDQVVSGTSVSLTAEKAETDAVSALPKEKSPEDASERHAQDMK